MSEESREETIARVRGGGTRPPELEKAIEKSKEKAEEEKAAVGSGPRTHVFRGQVCPVVRTYYDSKNNLVFDVIERARTIVHHGKQVDVKVCHRVHAPDWLQKKYVIDYSQEMRDLPGEVDVDSEERADG